MYRNTIQTVESYFSHAETANAHSDSSGPYISKRGRLPSQPSRTGLVLRSHLLSLHIRSIIRLGLPPPLRSLSIQQQERRRRLAIVLSLLHRYERSNRQLSKRPEVLSPLLCD